VILVGLQIQKRWGGNKIKKMCNGKCYTVANTRTARGSAKTQKYYFLLNICSKTFNNIKDCGLSKRSKSHSGDVSVNNVLLQNERVNM